MISRSRGPGIRQIAGKFVSASASGSGDGTIGSPWTLAQAIAGAAAGDTIWLRGGTYASASTWSISNIGSAGNPIWFRSYPGEWATVTQSTTNQTALDLTATAQYVHLRDLTVQHTSTNRTAAAGISITLDDRALGSQLVNLAVLDGGMGIGHWEQCGAGGVASTVYGCIVLDNGDFPSGGGQPSGPGIYTQNRSPAVKTLKHNVFANVCENGIKSGTDAGYVEDFQIIENIVMCPGAHYSSHVGTGASDATEIYTLQHPMTGNVWDGNVFWVVNDGAVDLNGAAGFHHYYGGTAVDHTITNNWIKAATDAVFLEMPTSGFITMTGNTISVQSAAWGGNRLIGDLSGSPTRTYDHNDYYTFGAGLFDAKWQRNLTDYANTLADWQTAIGQEANSTFVRQALPPDRTWVHANLHEAGRANITVHNAIAQAANVNVNVDAVLSTGQSWWLYNAANPFAGAVASGTYTSGVGISVPMTTGVVGASRTPAGLTAQGSQLPDFGVFILRRVGPTWVAPPTSLAT